MIFKQPMMGVHVQTAMIIDDDADLGDLLTLILEKRKIHTLAVHSLSEAEECLACMKPTVIFLDNSFPDGLGVNFIEHIRSADEEIKIIMLTADTASWIREKAMEQGINYFLEKPVTPGTIDFVLDKLDIRKNPDPGAPGK
jgi:DNA-binding response OmpR family regulator